MSVTCRLQPHALDLRAHRARISCARTRSVVKFYLHLKHKVSFFETRRVQAGLAHRLFFMSTWPARLCWLLNARQSQQDKPRIHCHKMRASLPEKDLHVSGLAPAGPKVGCLLHPSCRHFLLRTSTCPSWRCRAQVTASLALARRPFSHPPSRATSLGGRSAKYACRLHPL